MRVATLVSTLILLLLAGVVLVSPRLAYSIAGFKPFGELEPRALDEPPPPEENREPSFLKERNQEGQKEERLLLIRHMLVIAT